MLVGAHLDNIDSPDDSSYRRLRLMRAEIVVTLFTAGTRHRKPVYERLAALGVQRLVIRVGDEWIAGTVADYLRDVDEAVANAVAGGFPESSIDVQILNEVNLRTDADTAGWFVGEVVRKWRRQARPILTPLSRGVPAWREYEAAFVHAMGEYPADRLLRGVHVYAQDAESLLPVGPEGLPCVITEFSREDIGGRARGLWIVERLKDFARKGYGYACQFIVDGESHGAWPQSYVMTDAEAIALGERGTLPEPDKEPTPMPPIPNPWNQRLFTIWNLPADPQEVVRACAAWGCSGVEIKIADGNSSWFGSRRHVTPGYVQALKNAGLTVLGWTYNYCDGKRDAGDRGDGIPEEEADAAVAAVGDLRLDGWTADLEIECEGHGDLVAILLDRFRRKMPGVPMAAHTWADLAGHDGYPIHEISVLVDVIRPMIYRPIWNAVDCLSSLSGRINDKPMVPVWGITEATPELLKLDRNVWRATTGYDAEAFWEFTARGREDLRAVVVGTPNPVPTPVPDPIALAFADVKASVARLEEALARR